MSIQALQQARLLIQQGRPEQALSLLQTAGVSPENPEASLLLAECLIRCGQAPRGVAIAQDVLARWADNDSVVAAGCYMLAGAGRVDDAVARLKAAAEQQPRWMEVRCRLGAFYIGREQFDLAAQTAREALAIQPREGRASLLLARACTFLGRAAEASRVYADAIRADPHNQALVEAHAFTLNSHAHADPKEVLEAHRKVGELYSGHAAPLRFAFPERDDPERRISVGLVSHDFNNHSVASFVEAVMRHLDRKRFGVTAYFTSKSSDAVTARLRPLADSFVDAPGISSIDLARRIHADRIDVLIDLNGLTVGHRLHTFQLKPAPVQITWLGYPNTTGLSTIDYRLVDSVTDPPGAEAFATEQLLRLDPCFLCYAPVTERPEALGAPWSEPSPPATDHPVFGSFNNAAKISDQTVAAWAAVLAAVPRATMLIKAKGMVGPSGRQGVIERMTAAGVSLERLTIMPQARTVAEHLSLYGLVDAALDTLPYNGTTTTCEALLMGVPVLTTLGDRHSARVSASILTACGMRDSVAASADELPAVARRIVADTRALRAGRPARAAAFRASAVCNGPAFAVRFGQALSSVWRERCHRGVQRLPEKTNAN